MFFADFRDFCQKMGFLGDDFGPFLWCFGALKRGIFGVFWVNLGENRQIFLVIYQLIVFLVLDPVYHGSPLVAVEEIGQNIPIGHFPKVLDLGHREKMKNGSKVPCYRRNRSN